MVVSGTARTSGEEAMDKKRNSTHPGTSIAAVYKARPSHTDPALVQMITGTKRYPSARLDLGEKYVSVWAIRSIRALKFWA
jgi:hypothetical protein